MAEQDETARSRSERDGSRQLDDPERNTQQDDKILLGRIAGVHGVQGWVKVFSYTDPMESIVDYSPWYIRPETNKHSPWTRVKPRSGRRHAKTVIAKLEHCNDRDQALSLVGHEIAIEASQLEPLDGDNAYYWRELIGLSVVNRESQSLGTVVGLMETGANDVMVVLSRPEQRERLIPWTPGHTVDRVDMETGVIHVDWHADWDTDS